MRGWYKPTIAIWQGDIFLLYFIDGALGTKEAVAIVPRVKEKLENFQGKIIFTRDTHFDNYMDTQEGHNLPVPHCIKGTVGWEIEDTLKQYCKEAPVDKVAFGSSELGNILVSENEKEEVENVILVGLCTDICVISNAMIVKAFLPEAKVTVDAACCAGVTPKSHKNALEAMKVCQITVENEV